MGRLTGSSLLLLTVLIVLPSDELHAQKDKKKMDVADVKSVDSAKLQSGEFVGTLKSTPGTDRNFVVTVETQKLVPTGKNPPRINGNNSANRVIQLQNNMLRDQQQLLSARTPQQRMQYQQRLLRDQQQLQNAIVQLQLRASSLPPGYKVDTVKQDVEFQAAEAVKTRTMVLPEAFDDKGNPKKYKKEELDELKGKDKTAPGYESSLEKLEAGMKVRVVLGPAPAPAKKDVKDKEKEKDKDVKENKDVDKDDVAADKRMQAKMIVVLEEAAPTGKGNLPKKKNK